MRRSADAAVLLALLCVGCDRSGIHPLGRIRDPFADGGGLVLCDVDTLGRVETTSTWVRSTDEGTEIILLGRSEATAVVPSDSPACFAHGFVAHDSSTTFDFGSYALAADGAGFASTAVKYTFVFQPNIGILSRDGSRRTDLPAPISTDLEIVADGSQILVTLGGETMRMTNLGEVIEALDTTTQEGAEDVFRVYNLPLFTSQARLLGFGSGAMTQYVGPVATFVGAVRNRFTVNVEALLKPNTNIVYYQFEDLTGIVIDGLQRTNVNTSGNGSMEGTLSFVMRGTGGATDVRIRGYLDYEGLEIGNGFAAGGTYTLSFDGSDDEFPISYELATDIDLRGVLPVEAP